MIPIKDASPNTFDSMYKQYIELKVILTACGIHLTELDKIKE